MDYMTLKEAAEKWGVTPRRVNYYCAAVQQMIRRKSLKHSLKNCIRPELPVSWKCIFHENVIL